MKLVLSDGEVFEGESFGAELSVSGEVVFNTGMVGYPESLTDPSYEGQILVLTYPLVGNYGVPEGMPYFESEKIHIRALIVSEYSWSYSHWSARKSLSEWLIRNNVPAMHGVDTRRLTKKLREKGVMLGKVVFEEDVPFEDPNKFNLVSKVSISEPVVYEGGDLRVVLIDCGVKQSIIRQLLNKGITVVRVPWDYDFYNMDYDGVLISNGPGDPKMCTPTINHVKKAMNEEKPVFGICLGHQILGLAAGADTYKLKYGHRGQNQPCVLNGTKRCFITSQNHGFAINDDALGNDWKVWFSNVNDRTNEGIIHSSGIFRSVQFHPEASPGPFDAGYLFDEFKEVMLKWKK